MVDPIFPLPLTQLVVLLSALIGWMAATSLWGAYCMQVERAAFAAAPAWKRLLHTPAVAFAGGLPVTGGLSAALVWTLRPVF